MALVHQYYAPSERPSIRWPSGPSAAHDLGMKSRVHPTYKTKYRVTNWAQHDRALVQRGDITAWLSRAIDAWKPKPTVAHRCVALLHCLGRATLERNISLASPMLVERDVTLSDAIGAPANAA